MANAWLGIFLLGFWAGLWLLAKFYLFAHGQRLSDGPSFIPVVPILPLLAYGLGWVLNWVVPWLGTGVVAVAHGCYLFAIGVSAWRDLR
jgi:hypothetical protein